MKEKARGGSSGPPRPSREETWHEERGEVEVEGGVIRYRLLGDGERTLVLLHGGPGRGSLYLKPLERLAGPTAASSSTTSSAAATPTGPRIASLWRADRFVDELEALRAHLGLDEFDLYGHSWGGMLATDYALAHQEHLRSLVLASTIADAALLRREMARLLEAFPERSARRFAATKRPERPSRRSTRTRSWPSTGCTSAAATRGRPRS